MPINAWLLMFIREVKRKTMCVKLLLNIKTSLFFSVSRESCFVLKKNMDLCTNMYVIY